MTLTLLFGLALVALLYEFAVRWYAPGGASFGAAAGSVNVWNVRSAPAPLALGSTGLDLSARLGIPATILVLDAAWKSLVLIVLAVGWASATGIPAGFWLAVHAPPSVAALLRSLTAAAIALPAFFLVFLLQVIAVEITRRIGRPLIPVFGFGIDGHLVLPVAALGAVAFSYITRYIQLAAVDLNARDFIRTARAKGLGERAVVYRHIAPNMLGTLGAAVLGGVRLTLGALVIVEYMLVWPGLGLLTLRAINVQDLTVFLGAVTVLAALFLSTELTLDAVTRRTGVITG